MTSLPSFARAVAPALIALSTLVSALAVAPVALRAAEPAAETPAEPGAPVETAITNVYAGQSVIRFANPSTTDAARLSVDVYGVTDAAILGSFQIEVPPMASREVRPEEQLRTFAPVNWDQLVVLYVSAQNGAPLWQHLRQDAKRGSVLNASVCTYIAGAKAVPNRLVLNAPLTHMFAAPFSPYHSFISLHNPSDAAVAFDAEVYDAASGELKGRVDMALPPHGSLQQSAHWFQSSALWYFPRPDQKTMNIRFVPKAGSEAAADALIVGHMLMDMIDGGGANLSTPCPIDLADSARN